MLAKPLKNVPHTNDISACASSQLYRWIEGLLTFFVFFTMGADPAPHRNEAHYLCRLKHFWDPEWCQGDLFLDSPDAHFTVVWLLGWLTLFFSLETVAWIGRLICWTLLALAWQRLHRRIAPVTLLAPLTAALFVVGTEQFHLAGEWLIGGFEAKTLAYGIVVLALSDAIDGRWNRGWILLGIASAMHALVGAWSVVALFLAWSFGKKQQTLRGMAPGLVIGAGISMLGVWPAIALNLDTDSEIVSKANEIYVFMRLPHHLSLLTMDPSWLMNRVLRHAIVIILLILTGRLLKNQSNANHQEVSPSERNGLSLLRAFAWASLCISATGFVIEIIGFNHLAWSASLLKYYWWRLADIAVPLAVAMSFASCFKHSLASQRGMALVALVSALLFVGWGLGGHSLRKLDGVDAPADTVLNEPDDWFLMCEWVSLNTPKDSCFFVPRRSHSFKWYTGQPEVVTYKDVPQDAATMLKWHERFHDVYQIGYNEDGSKRWTRSLSHLGTNRLLELGNLYNADFVLSQDVLNRFGQPRRQAHGLPVLHRVGRYTLYDLRALTESDKSISNVN